MASSGSGSRRKRLESGGWRDAAPIRGETLGVVGESGCRQIDLRPRHYWSGESDRMAKWPGWGKDLLGMKQEEWRDVRSEISR
ncbi:hypothetical protein LN650_12850 [Klebsiella pneumoniae subsp. pneumoniae]|nr:hypothetical protein [Klebsiella pneumoniae subsp. pneumoniae]